MGNGYGNISHKANLKNFLKPWIPTASCIVGFDFFCWLMIFLKQRVFNTPSATETDFAVCLGVYVFFWLSIAALIVSIGCYSVTCFLSFRLLSDQQRLRFVFYRTHLFYPFICGSSWLFLIFVDVLPDRLHIVFSLSIVFVVSWFLSAYIAFISSRKLKNENDTFLKSNEKFEKLSRMTGRIGLCLLCITIYLAKKSLSNR